MHIDKLGNNSFNNSTFHQRVRQNCKYKMTNNIKPIILFFHLTIQPIILNIAINLLVSNVCSRALPNFSYQRKSIPGRKIKHGKKNYLLVIPIPLTTALIAVGNTPLRCKPANVINRGSSHPSTYF